MDYHAGNRLRIWPRDHPIGASRTGTHPSHQSLCCRACCRAEFDPVWVETDVVVGRHHALRLFGAQSHLYS